MGAGVPGRDSIGRPSRFLRRPYDIDAGKNGERGYRVLVQTLEQTHCIAVGTFTWRGKATPIAIRVHENGLLRQRLYSADEVHNAVEIDRVPSRRSATRSGRSPSG